MKTTWIRPLTVMLLTVFLMIGCTPPVAAQETELPSKADSPEKTDYAEEVFDASYIHTIDVTISEEDWSDLLAHPTDKTKYRATVVIDDETVENVAFSTKGSSSLMYVADDENSYRYSYKINFGKGSDRKNWHGIRKINLNNMFADATNMRDYLSYRLFGKMGVAAPGASYVWLTVNGEAQGLRIAVEEVDQCFVDRAFGGEGTLYEPKHGKIKADGVQNFKKGGSVAKKNVEGADLVYVDDLPEHYPDIFDNAITEDDAETQARVIRALKYLSEQEDLETYLDTEALIRYFAVHNFLVNFDSYTGPMVKNYFLYEHEGRLSMIPWDYNLIFGEFPADAVLDHIGDSTDVVNQGIDSPLSGSPQTEADRPMWSWIVADETYRTEYHNTIDELISGYIDSGEFEEEFDALYEMLLPYVEKDPTAFYTAEEFTTAYETMREVVLLRTESIHRQLDGKLAPVSEQQEEEDRVDASNIRIADMGMLPQE